jgi:uncharacterized protein YjdB
MQKLMAASGILILAMSLMSCGSGNHLVSVAVTPNPAHLTVGQTLQLQATGTYSDGTMKVLTGASWGVPSSNPVGAPEIAVSSSGLASCKTAGGPWTITVTASFAGLSGFAPMACG